MPNRQPPSYAESIKANNIQRAGFRKAPVFCGGHFYPKSSSAEYPPLLSVLTSVSGYMAVINISIKIWEIWDWEAALTSKL